MIGILNDISQNNLFTKSEALFSTFGEFFLERQVWDRKANPEANCVWNNNFEKDIYTTLYTSSSNTITDQVT